MPSRAEDYFSPPQDGVDPITAVEAYEGNPRQRWIDFDAGNIRRLTVDDQGQSRIVIERADQEASEVERVEG